ncbi:Non-specific serine/threonine protein kinase [Aphelenchoides besseyi]|nr:Non-specific serine/threonine protein kinase [Aphelenchoides besseyi]KAI6199990.1 Non-specific serine/threonine protein kinase [Aphelenchoides besseyi]
MGLTRNRKIRRKDISAPTGFRHAIHVEVDALSGRFVNLPKQWASLMQVEQSPRPKPLISAEERTCPWPARTIVGVSSPVIPHISGSSTIDNRSESPIRSPTTSRPITVAVDGQLALKRRSVKNALKSIVNPEDPRNFLHHIQKLGEGSSSTVYQVYNTNLRKTIALKRIVIDKQIIPDLLLNEVYVMKTFPHPNIIKYMGSYLVENNTELWISMELAVGGLLTDYVCKKRLLEESIATITQQCLNALSYLHSKRIIHRDVKSDSVLLTADRVVKLSDLGFVAILTEQWPKRRSLLGTPYWTSPEALNHEFYGVETDIWSLGITVVEMIIGEPFHFNHNPQDAIEIIRTSPAPRIPDFVAVFTLMPAGNALQKVERTFKHVNNRTSSRRTISSELRSFVESMLVRNPPERATADRLLQHPFIAKALTDPTLVIL